jgi:hypothetical protein
MSDAGDIEVPESDAAEQSVAVVDGPEEPPVEVLSGDLEVPEADALEQHLPAHEDDGDAWR